MKGGQTFGTIGKAEDCEKFLFNYHDGIEFIVDVEYKQISVFGVRKSSLQAAIHYLLFSVACFLLGLRNFGCLHAAAFAFGSRTIALVGNSCFGKSLLSAKMAQCGIEVLSDDLVSLDVTGNAVQVYPGYPWICLRTGSLSWLNADSADALRFCSSWCYLDESYVTFDLRPPGDVYEFNMRNLDVIYLLAPIAGSNCKPQIEGVPRHRALIALMESVRRIHPYPEFRRQDFTLMARIIAEVPTYLLRYHLSNDGLATLSNLLVDCGLDLRLLPPAFEKS
jgi:hypothetical protein